MDQRYYLKVTWCVGMIPPPAIVVLLMVVITVVLAIVGCSIKNKDLTKKEQDNSTEENCKENCSKEKRCSQWWKECLCFCCSCYKSCTKKRWENCCFKFALGYSYVLVMSCQFLFGSGSVQLINEESYKIRCIKIGSRFFKLNMWVLWKLTIYVLANIGIICGVALNYLVVHETYFCREDIDCFARNGLHFSNEKITNCTFQGDNPVTCYEIHFKPAVAVALIGGYIKLVPPIGFMITTGYYLVFLPSLFKSTNKKVRETKSTSRSGYDSIDENCTDTCTCGKCTKKKCCHVENKCRLILCIVSNLVIFFLTVAAFATIATLTGMKLLNFLFENKERSAQILAFLLLLIVFSSFPWYAFECCSLIEKEIRSDIYENKQDKKEPDEEEHSHVVIHVS